jgi:hypothetical protein
MYQSDEQYKERVEAWEASQPEVEVTPKGNAVSQEFYTRDVLPKHITEIQALETHYKHHKHRFLLQEDGDPSHGNKSTDNPCARLKRDADPQILIHPAQSPDLNPIESCWQIVKINYSVIRGEYTGSKGCGSGSCKPCVPIKCIDPTVPPFASKNFLI